MDNSMWLQDAGVGAVGGFFMALLILHRLVGPSEEAYARVSVARRWRIIGVSVLIGAVLLGLYGFVRSDGAGFDIAVGALGGLFIAFLILWRIGPSDEAYKRITVARRWVIIGVSVAMGAALMWLYGNIR